MNLLHALFLGTWIACVLLTAIGIVLTLRASESKPRQTGVILIFLGAVLTYGHPWLQEELNGWYLEPKLDASRAMVGRDLSELLGALGEPDQTVHPGAGRESYLIFGAAPWTPFARTELLVPLSDQGTKIGAFAHLVD